MGCRVQCVGAPGASSRGRCVRPTEFQTAFCRNHKSFCDCEATALWNSHRVRPTKYIRNLDGLKPLYNYYRALLRWGKMRECLCICEKKTPVIRNKDKSLMKNKNLTKRVHIFFTFSLKYPLSVISNSTL